MKPEHPTGLEIRFEREMAATIPGWKSEIAAMEPAIEPATPVAADEEQKPRYQPPPSWLERRRRSRR